MAPPGRRRARSSTRKSRRIHYKKRLDQSKKEAASNSVDLPTSKSITKNSDHHDLLKVNDIDFDHGVDLPTSGCSTPKAQRFRIPEILTCPPAPKKRRLVSNCSLQRAPIAFFAPPDIELFFFFALRDVSN